MTYTAKTTDDIAREVIAQRLPYAEIISIGGAFTGYDDEPPFDVRTVTLDMRGQGQDVRVYEVTFYEGGTGQSYCVASSGMVEHDSRVFEYEVKP